MIPSTSIIFGNHSTSASSFGYLFIRFSLLIFYLFLILSKPLLLCFFSVLKSVQTFKNSSNLSLAYLKSLSFVGLIIKLCFTLLNAQYNALSRKCHSVIFNYSEKWLLGISNVLQNNHRKNSCLVNLPNKFVILFKNI